MAYSIELTDAGRRFYANNDRDLEKAVIYLIERIGAENWRRRRQAVHDRFFEKLKTPPKRAEGVSIRDRDDEIGWYLFLGETLIADPPAVESDQVHRIWPYLSAFGRKLDAILAIKNVEERIARLVREVKDQDPDQALFELFVGAAYVEDGWSVEAIPESATKTPDFEIKRGLVRYEVESKRLTRRGEYTERERDAWLRQWQPAAQWLADNRLSFFLTILIHVELTTLPDNYIFDALRAQYEGPGKGFRSLNSAALTIDADPTDYPRIAKALSASNTKCQSSAERALITGRYEPDFGLTSIMGGNRVTIGPPSVAGNIYWDSVAYASGAYWRTDAPAAIDAKARDIVKRLAEATAQFSGRRAGIVHLGIEAGEGDDVELIRTDKVIATVRRFDPRGKPLEWVFVHYFKGASLPNGTWTLDETWQWHGPGPALFKPLRVEYLVCPPGTPSVERFADSNGTTPGED